MAQQTAVEWYIDELFKLQLKYVDSDLTSVAYNDLKKQLKDKAKQMFQQQIEAAWKRGDGEHDKVADKLAKQYYTETYTNEPR
jgi:ABC-type phosphate transport system auxiliary subunit